MAEWLKGQKRRKRPKGRKRRKGAKEQRMKGARDEGSKGTKEQGIENKEGRRGSGKHFVVLKIKKSSRIGTNCDPKLSEPHERPIFGHEGRLGVSDGSISIG